VDQNIDLGSGNPAAVYPGDSQTRANVEDGYRAFENLGLDTGIHQRAQKHVAADARETI